MTRMGWKRGTGLGKYGQGALEPVFTKPHVKRYGFGHPFAKAITSDNEHIRAFLHTFKTAPTVNLVVFSPDFTEEERKLVRRQVVKFKLQVMELENRGTYLVVGHRLRNESTIFPADAREDISSEEGDPDMLYEVDDY